MTDSIRLIVGLGNPGPEYHHTRHNAGFDFVDFLAEQHNGRWQSDKKFFAEICRITADGQEILLLKPQTFMNRSGKSVAAVTNFFKLTLDNILVAYDELDLPPGVARLKVGGGHGGHNGMRDIITCLGNQRDFKRLRIGIGHPGHSSQVVGYVLGRAPQAESGLIELAMVEAARNLNLIIGQWHRAMTELNSFKASK
ncbi:aminoacyl-tRNA hydrolase [Gynuella sunshinyii]|uniref:Peptidyl-tRNA hydrolase n=1 Tax=Gynuella sunshinyii YC6258 TaxID=1445510 RepID=A0A0C5VST9_9GAMM|nr:aminoacyl-tRNA hydrolase [Gynuella sunshinyii]AJQ96413.1 peptidyl-tRNA hydrolase [Gynuella sunshinyii YC6258]